MPRGRPTLLPSVFRFAGLETSYTGPQVRRRGVPCPPLRCRRPSDLHSGPATRRQERSGTLLRFTCELCARPAASARGVEHSMRYWVHRKCPRWSASCARRRLAHPTSLLQTATQPSREVDCQHPRSAAGPGGPPRVFPTHKKGGHRTSNPGCVPRQASPSDRIVPVIGRVWGLDSPACAP